MMMDDDDMVTGWWGWGGVYRVFGGQGSGRAGSDGEAKQQYVLGRPLQRLREEGVAEGEPTQQ